MGTPDSYRVGERQMSFTEPAHVGPANQHLGQRKLATVIWYPQAHRSAGSQPASGPFPLLVFAPGLTQCADPYSDLLQAWARAGYVVAAVNFPRTDCQVAAPDEPDIANQPADMSYVLSSLLALSARPHDVFSGLVNRHQIAVAGHSDGGDTVAAPAANIRDAEQGPRTTLRGLGVAAGIPGKQVAVSACPARRSRARRSVAQPP